MPVTREKEKHSHREHLAEAYERFGPEVYRYLAVMLGCRHRAEDILQEVFLKLLRVARRDPDALQHRGYVFRVGRNEAFRALAKRRRVPPQNNGLLVIADPSGGSEAERLAIQEALAQLPPEQREAVHLKIFMNMTFEEIADLTEVSPNTAASRYRYGLDKLRGPLADKEDET